MLRGVISYWILPLFSAVVWLAMLLTMILYWVTTGKPRYSTIRGDQKVPYISDIGADTLKPLFIAMGTVSVVAFDFAFLAERWLRHIGRLTSNVSLTQKVLAILSIVFAVVGGAGLILLTIFDTKRHHSLHDVFLSLFIGGYVVSAIFICAEYQRLGIHFREHRILRLSFWIKLVFIVLEIGLAIAFGTSNRLKHYNTAAIVEWVIALVYTFYVMSFIMDFLPALHSGPNQQSGQTEEELAVATSDTVLHDSEAHRYRGTDDPPRLPQFSNDETSGHLFHDNSMMYDESKTKSLDENSAAP